MQAHDAQIIVYRDASEASAIAAAASAAAAAVSAGAAAGVVLDHIAETDPHTQYVLESAIGSTVQAYDADTAKTDVAQNYTLPQRSALLTDNDGNFDLSAKQNFKCTTAAGLTLTFTNQADGLSGSVYFVNSSNHAIAAHANTKLTTSDLTKLSATGTYRIDYMTDGTNALCSVVGPYA
jgi:ATP-dependent exoDNAse (exonuclease V) beta subunit